MKLTFVRLGFCGLLATFCSSCRLIGAGSHVFCKTITAACASNCVIQRLTELKSSGRFDDARSSPDILRGNPPLMYDFYFYDPAHQFLVAMEVPLNYSKNTKIHLAALKDFASGSEWVAFADVPAAKRKMVFAWFDQVIRPALEGETIGVKPCP